MSLEYIRKTYGVPAKRGAPVRFTPDSRDKSMDGRIVGSRGALLRVRFDGFKKPWLCHPTWEMKYTAHNGDDKHG